MFGQSWMRFTALMAGVLFLVPIVVFPDEAGHAWLVPPTDVPEVFVPGIISLWGSTYRESQLSLWPDGLRLIFARFGPGIPDSTIFESTFVDGTWSVPKPTALFENSIALEPGLSPDGAAIFYSMPASGHGMHNILVIRHTDEGWSRPRRLFRGLFPSISSDGTIYYTGYIGWEDHIVFRRLLNGEYGEEETIGAPIFSSHEDAHPCVAPDESYVIFDSATRPHEGPCPLFVSFRSEDGSWTEPVHMGPVLGDPPAALPRISPDGTILFFHANGDIYWISTAVIEQLR